MARWNGPFKCSSKTLTPSILSHCVIIIMPRPKMTISIQTIDYPQSHASASISRIIFFTIYNPWDDSIRYSNERFGNVSQWLWKYMGRLKYVLHLQHFYSSHFLLIRFTWTWICVIYLWCIPESLFCFPDLDDGWRTLMWETCSNQMLM